MQEDQYQAECAALSDSNFNLACETGIWYPFLVAMLNSPSMMWHMKVMYHDVHVHTGKYCEQNSTSWYVLGRYSDILVINRPTLEVALVM